MWGFALDGASEKLCRTYNAALGFFPKPCLVNAGRPAFWATLAALLVLIVLVRFGVRRLRRLRR